MNKETATALPDLVFVDVETTGLDETTNEIVEVALVRLHPVTLEPVARFHSLVFPVGPVPEHVAKINGYDAKQWAKQARPLADVMIELAPLLAGGVLAGQNPSFDQRFLRKNFAACGVPWPAMDYHLIDTGVLTWPFVVAGKLPGMSLRYSRSFFCLIPGDQAHRALQDVNECIAVYKELMRRYVGLASGDPRFQPAYGDAS